MTDFRKIARGKPCMIRLQGCDGGGQTTVLAHYRLSGYAGVGMKPDDLAFGAWACAHCHDICDARKKSDLDRLQIRLYHAEGCMRTAAELRKLGHVK